jgi:arylsulfatase A-like enzyme
LQLDGGERTVPFHDLFYQLDLVKSGIHHPDGLMWIRTPARSHSVNREKVPLVSVAPTMLGLLGIEPPSQMKGEPLEAAGVPA